MLAIEADALRRTYTSRTGWPRSRRTETEAVRGVTFEVAPGELFGLLGPNGAGKTTTIKMLNTLLLPTSGTARVFGHDVARDPVAVRRRIGYVFGGDRGLYDRLSALDNLRYFAELYGVPARDQKRRIAELLDLVGLVGREKERVEGYSRGMRQRLHIARGLLHHPDVLFLDEPSIGVDPVAARDLRRTVADLAAAGTTVLLTTHYMAEADELCDRIAVIAGGRIRALGTPDSLKSLVRERDVLEIEAYGVDEERLDRVRRVPGVRGVSTEDRGALQTVTVQTGRGASDLHGPVLAALDGVRIGRVTNREPSLEDAYIAIVEETAGPGSPGTEAEEAAA
ncbi:ABC transporter ATP-binding protein [Streptomyces litmocidini]|uniref:ATP-binding cassette domain-containing protein n=1 Tax=Streptomyces litmocidini TaxID=67318 RepID=A0ABW7U2N4_9ACTN